MEPRLSNFFSSFSILHKFREAKLLKEGSLPHPEINSNLIVKIA